MKWKKRYTGNYDKNGLKPKQTFYFKGTDFLLENFDILMLISLQPDVVAL